MSEAIAWIEQAGGRWGAPADLALPLDDRGLLLGVGVFETVLVEAGRPRLLAEHLARWRHGADVLALAAPPEQERVEALLAEAVARSGIRSGALRLNWSGGGGGRGLEAPPPAASPDSPGPERFWLQLTALHPCFDPVDAVLSRWERRHGGSLLSRCKTFQYASQVLARREARLAGCQEALLLGEGGQLCCATAANLLVRLEGQWCTPPLASGCLPGVMRGRALAQGWLREARLEPAALRLCQAALLLNSLGCRRVRCFAAQPLPVMPASAVEALWRSLL